MSEAEEDAVMPILDAATTALLLIDFQERLMPVIDDGAVVLGHARRLLDAARLLGVPVLATEQNPMRLGGTVAGLGALPQAPVAKMAFDATSALMDHLPDGCALLVAGCEAHVCVLQTVLGLLAQGRRVAVARDAIGSRRVESREAAVRRMESHGAEIVTAEMAIFEWVGTCEHPRFREALTLVR